MVGVDDHGGIFQALLFVEPVQEDQVLIVVVGPGFAVLVGIAPENGVGIGIPGRGGLPAPVDEGMAVLGGVDRIHHDGQVTAGGVLHAHGHGDTGAGEPVLLVLHGPGSHGHIGQHIVQVLVILGVEHFVGAGEAGLPEHPHMELPDGNQPLEHIRGGVGVRLVEHTLVARTGGPGLVGVDPRDDEQLVFHLFLDGDQTGDIIQNAVLPVGRAGADDQGQTAVPAA